METGVLISTLIAGGIWAAKQLGVIVAWVVVDSWFRDSGIAESDAVLALDWADRTVFFPTMYDLVYQEHVAHLDSKGRASLNASVVIATKAATEGSLNYWEATAMQLTLEALAKKLIARQGGGAGSPDIGLLPAVELQGSPMVLAVGGDLAGPMAGSVVNAAGSMPALLILAAAGAGAWALWRFAR